jgi:hypothetical protein
LKAAHNFAGKGHVSAYGSLARDGAQIYRGGVWGRIHGAQTLSLHSGCAEVSHFSYKESNSDRQARGVRCPRSLDVRGLFCL